MTSGSAAGADTLSPLAVAANRKKEIKLGTVITQTFYRHPVAVGQQVLVLAQLVPERFRLGFGYQRPVRHGTNSWGKFQGAAVALTGVYPHRKVVAPAGFG